MVNLGLFIQCLRLREILDRKLLVAAVTPYWHYKKSLKLVLNRLSSEKVQVGKDQEKAQSEKDTHSKNREGTFTMKTYRKPNEQLFSQ